MSVNMIGNKILKTYTNRNRAVFKSASKLAYNSIKNDDEYTALIDMNKSVDIDIIYYIYSVRYVMKVFVLLLKPFS